MKNEIIAAVKNNELDILISQLLDSGSYRAHHDMIYPLRSRLEALSSLLAPIQWAGPRATLEYDQTFRQVIPCATLFSPLGDQVLTYRRSGSEKRLVGQYSISFGGHIDVLKDGWLGDSVMRSLRRELSEELGIQHYIAEPEQWHIITRNDTPVNRAHVGLWCAIYLNKDALNLSHEQDEAENLKWMSLDEVCGELYDLHLEGWGRTIANYIQFARANALAQP